MQTAAGPESKIEDWVATAGVVGLWEVLKMYSYFKKQLQAITARILQQQPSAVILVDYPGFNLRLASALRQSGYRGKLIYYISPQVWAWKKGRVKTMARVLDLMICIFPFEKDFYEASGLPTVFAGHPITELTQQPDLPPREFNLIGFFPGSRKTEVRRLLPILLSTATQLQRLQPDLRFVISAANQSLATLIREIATGSGQPQAADWIQIGNSRQLMQTCTAGAVASGTATLEAAAIHRIVAGTERGAVSAALSAIAERMDRAMKAGDWAVGGELDFAFHRTLVDAAGSDRLSRTYATVQAETRLCLHRLMGGYRRSEALADEHVRLARMIADAPVEAVLDELTRHFGDPAANLRKARGAGDRSDSRGPA
jgi:DNA-binding FadR family transcriptional regulator